MSSLIDIANYFKHTLDIPDYYFSQRNFDKNNYDYELYAHINSIDIYIRTPEFKLFNSKAKIINSMLCITNGIIEYDLLLPIDDYTILIINDVIKYFKGVIL